MERKWIGSWPANCDFCTKDLSKEKFFVDGKTTSGPWGLMCPRCHKIHGRGIGQGSGQKYDSVTRVKLEG